MDCIHQFACWHLKMGSDCQKKNYDHHPVNQYGYTGGRRKASAKSWCATLIVRFWSLRGWVMFFIPFKKGTNLYTMTIWRLIMVQTSLIGWKKVVFPVQSPHHQYVADESTRDPPSVVLVPTPAVGGPRRAVRTPIWMEDYMFYWTLWTTFL